MKLRVREITLAARETPSIGYLIFEIAPDRAYKCLPVSVSTFDKSRNAIDTGVECDALLGDTPFLDPRFDYPLGRHDWLGANTIPDWRLVYDEIDNCLRHIWHDLDLGVTPPPIYVGSELYEDWDSPRELHNLHTGQTETISFSYDD